MHDSQDLASHPGEEFSHETSRRPSALSRRMAALKLLVHPLKRAAAANQPKAGLNKRELTKRAAVAARQIRHRTRPAQLDRDYRQMLHITQELSYDRAIEKLLFVPARGRVPLDRLTIESYNRDYGHAYYPVHRLSFEWAMAQLPKKLNEFTFVDYGAGRGRAILLASLYDFRRIIGVEFASELHDDSVMNIAQFPRSLMKCRNVECVHMDAADFPIPEGPGVFFFNDPFDGEVMETVLARLSAAYRTQPRRMYLVFVHPPRAEVLDRLIENAVIFEPVYHSRSEKMRLRLFSPDEVQIYCSLM